MTSHITALHQDIHGSLKIRAVDDFEALYKEHVIPVVVHEFIRASLEYPVVFVKNVETGQFQAVILTGLAPNENLFVNGRQWRGRYIPRIIRNQPFKLLPNSHDHDQLMVAIDENSPFCGFTDGAPLFDDNGAETPCLAERKKQLITHFEQNQVTEGFVQLLSDNELLAPRRLSVDIGGVNHDLQGLYGIDEGVLNTLSPEKFLDLRTRGFLPVIYAHLASLHQVERLARLKIGKA